ncbi:MAG: VanZ family protein [Clostridia bacterium]|nr:VanZ family protein [Clostridia bacterium]
MIKFLKNKYTRWLMVIVWMIVIFMMSHMNSVKSWYLTGELLTVFQTGSVNTEATFEEKMSSYNEDDTANLMVYIRKLAHVIQYMILGILVYFALSETYAIRKSAVGAMSVGWLTGYFDELHQLFVPGRTGSLADVFLDGFGVTLGVAFCVWTEVRLRKVRKYEA